VKFLVSGSAKGGGEVKDTTFQAGGQKFLALNVPWQCPFVLPTEVRLRQGKALGSEVVFLSQEENISIGE
jgi:hypothetical protein